MDLTAISSMAAISALSGIEKPLGVSQAGLSGALVEKDKRAGGTLFDAFLNSAIDNIKETNKYLSEAENEEIKFALGETDNIHDLTIALQKASTALQYTVAVRDKVLEAYRELMQMQI